MFSTAFRHLVQNDKEFAGLKALLKPLLVTLASQQNLFTIFNTFLYFVAEETTNLREAEKIPLIIGDVIDMENGDVKTVRSAAPLVSRGFIT